MPTGRSTGGNPRRPIFAVDLVSNSDRMLLAHRRNHHQGTTLTQRLDTLNRKCQRSLDRMREDIRQIYFGEQLPREFEVLEMEARRRREERLLLQGRRALLLSQSATGGVLDEIIHTQVTPEQPHSPVTQLNYSPSLQTLTPHAATTHSFYNSELLQLNDSLPVPIRPEVTSGMGGMRATSGLEGSVYSRRPSMTTPWRRPSMLHLRDGSVTMDTSGPPRRKQSEEQEVGEGEAKPQKSPEEVMAAVRAVYQKTPMSKHNPRPQFWQKLIPPHLTPARLEMPPRPPPNQIRAQAKERLDAFLARLQEKYSQEEGVTHVLPGGEDCGEEEIDFTEAKWKPYKILLDETRAIYNKPRQTMLPERSRTYTSMTSHIVIPEEEVADRLYRNRIINGDGDSDVSSMSFVFSKSRPQSRVYSA